MLFPDMYQSRSLSLYTFQVQLPCPNDSFLFLLLDSCIFLVLAMYLDNVLPGEHGSPKHPLFMFQPSYWGCTRRRAAANHVPPTYVTSSA